MDNLNYVFFEEFKRLDKLCGEIYNAQNGVTHYIDDMKTVPGFEYRAIPNWDSDLQQLLRLRHIRNNLAHAEDAFLEETCTQKEIDWLRDFYQRILKQSDPMALRYQNAREREEKAKQMHVKNKESLQRPSQVYINDQINRKSNTFYWVILVAVVLALVVFGGIMLLRYCM